MNLIELPAQGFRWELNWKVCTFSALFLPLLFGLGVWQLNRAAEKLTITQEIDQEQAKPALTWQQLKNMNENMANYRAVELTGKFLKRQYWLLENKVVKGQVGMQVIMPFELPSGVVVLVNRGWVRTHSDRSILPSFSTPDNSVKLQGILVTPYKNKFLSNAGQDKGWPKRILQVQIDELANQLDRVAWPQLLLLKADSFGAFYIDWQPVTVSSERHKGYAVQWFSMAFALMVFTIIANSNLVEWWKNRKRLTQ